MNKNQIKEVAISFKKMAKAFSDIANITKIINDADKTILSYLCERVGWIRLFVEVNPLQIKFQPDSFSWYKESFIFNKRLIESKSTDLLRSFRINYHGTSNMFQAVTLIGQQFNMIVNKLRKLFPVVEEDEVFHPKRNKTTKKDHRKDNSRNDIRPINRISKVCDRDLPYQIRRITRISFFEEEVEYVRMTCDPTVSMSKLMMRKHHLDKLWEDYISYNQFKNEVVDDLQGFIDDLDNFDDLNLDSFEDGVKDRSTKRNSVIRTSILHGMINRNQRKI